MVVVKNRAIRWRGRPAQAGSGWTARPGYGAQPLSRTRVTAPWFHRTPADSPDGNQADDELRQPCCR
ncbi:MAG: hypothetical protein R2911_28340 [Caldilineaceae bacterium]